MTTGLITIFVTAAIIENVVLSQILGICPFIGVSKKSESALGMGLAVTFVLVLASVSTWLVYNYLLVPFHIEYLETVAFILVIAALVQFVEMVIKKTADSLYQSLGVYLPLITTNCAVLGISLINIKKNYTLMQAAVNGFGSGFGFMCALLIMAGIRGRLELSNVPKAMQGAPIAFITAGLLAVAFMGFSGLS